MCKQAAYVPVIFEPPCMLLQFCDVVLSYCNKELKGQQNTETSGDNKFPADIHLSHVTN